MTTFETWQSWRGNLLQLAESAGLEGAPGGPTAALTFAEKLILCPTQDAAKRLLLADREGALGFLEATALVAHEIEVGHIREFYPLPQNAGPFYGLAGVVVEYLSYMKRASPRDFY